MHLLSREAEKAGRGGLRPAVPTLGRLGVEVGQKLKTRTDDMREFQLA